MTRLHLTYPDGDLATVEAAAGLGDAGRLARQVGLRNGWVEDGAGRPTATTRSSSAYGRPRRSPPTWPMYTALTRPRP